MTPPAPHSGRGVRLTEVGGVYIGTRRTSQDSLARARIEIHASQLVRVKLHTPLPSCLRKAVHEISKLDQVLRNDTDNRQDNR